MRKIFCDFCEGEITKYNEMPTEKVFTHTLSNGSGGSIRVTIDSLTIEHEAGLGWGGGDCCINCALKALTGGLTSRSDSLKGAESGVRNGQER